MKARWCRISERILLSALLLMFLTPLGLAVVKNNLKHFAWPPWLHHPWFLNSSLRGVTVRPPIVPFSWRALARGDFQKSQASQFDLNFPGREAFIRATNEIWFQLFHDTANPTSTVTVGSNDALFETYSLQECFLQRPEKRALEVWIKDLRRLQDICRESGRGFVVLLTPSKASIQPEDTPLAWRRFYDPRPRAGVLLVELLRENGIAFVDGPALLAAEKRANKPIAPLFPKGGMHWNSWGAHLAADAVTALLREQGQPVGPIGIDARVISQEPAGDDKDLVSLMNLARPWNYPCERLSIRPGQKTKNEQLTMALVGGSFSLEIMRQLTAAREFSEITCFFYYTRSRIGAAEGVLSWLPMPGISLDFEHEIFASDCLLLEINEASAVSPENHLAVFLRDALAHRAAHPSK